MYECVFWKVCHILQYCYQYVCSALFQNFCCVLFVCFLDTIFLDKFRIPKNKISTSFFLRSIRSFQNMSRSVKLLTVVDILVFESCQQENKMKYLVIFLLGAYMTSIRLWHKRHWSRLYSITWTVKSLNSWWKLTKKSI